MFRRNEVLPAFDGEHGVDINLRAGVGQEPKMPLLTELENIFVLILQRGHACGVSDREQKQFVHAGPPASVVEQKFQGTTMVAAGKTPVTWSCQLAR